MEKVKKLQKDLEGKNAVEILQFISNLTNESITFSSSLGYEDQVLTHLIFTADLPIHVFTLDTGRLFPETYSVLNNTIQKYKKSIQVFFPNTKSIEELTTKKGPNSFYNSVEDRKECCYHRKVEPLKRALKGRSIWITGIRAEQSGNRADLPVVEWDDHNQIIKVHPLINWTLDEIKEFISKNQIPHNPLHNKGFVSIGCQPCTRAINAGEDFRAGRWWWEDANKKECGLHQ